MTSTQVETDTRHVWRPYDSMPASDVPLVVASAQGARLRLREPVAGHDELVDAMSSWWATIHGYRNPELDAALVAQAGRVSHVMLGGLSHDPVIGLTDALVAMTPVGLEHVFYSDSGSVAVEVAMKMALQYWRAAGEPGKHRFLTWRGGYHGDTLHAMSVCDPTGGMHAMWADVVPAQVFVDRPPSGFAAPVRDDYVASVERVLAAHAHEVAAIIVEPVVQGAGGMRFHNPAYVTELRRLADAYDVLLILDEIATGFGRTGELFAADLAGVTPDIMCVGKALTGGYLPMAATLSVPAIAERIAQGEYPALAHGPTFMGNPLAAAVAEASLSILRRGAWREDVARIGAALTAGLASLQDLPGVADVRVLGAIGVVQLDRPVDVAAATAAAAARGVWIRPFRDLVYTMPPYITGDDDLARIADAISAAVRSG